MTASSLTDALRETLTAFGERGVPLTTTEVAERLELGRRSTYDRLERLVDHGTLRSKKVGARGRVWWRPSETEADGRQREAWQTVQPVMRSVFDSVESAVVVVEDSKVVWASEAVERYFDVEREELVGQSDSAFAEATVADTLDRSDEFVGRMAHSAEARSSSGYAEFRVLPAVNRAERWVEHRTETVRSGGGTDRSVEVFHDVTERKRRERELRENRALYQAIVETVEDGIYAVNEDGEFVVVNEGFCRLTGYDRAELLGTHATLVHADEVTPEAERKVDQMVRDERTTARIELDVERSDGESIPCETQLSPFPFEGGYGRCGVVRDVSRRLKRERELQRRIYQQEIVTNLGRRALTDTNFDGLLAEATRLVAETLDADYCEVLDLEESDGRLFLRHGVGWEADIVGSASVSATEDGSQAAYTLRSDGPVVVSDLTAERRFDGPALLREQDVRSGISTVIGPSDDPWGILGVHDEAVREFSAHDVNFVQSVANIVASAIVRRDHERELVAQRERLAAINSLDEVVRETTDAVISQSTRSEIAETVCTHLAASDSYSFAWMGEIDPSTQTIDVRTSVGADGFLDGYTIPADLDGESAEPVGAALSTGEMRSTHGLDVVAEPASDRDRFGRFDLGSAAVIPVAYDDSTYGVLTVYSERRNAFEGEEGEVVSRLGEVVGHAIAAAERKRALMSDEVVELAFHVSDLYESLAICDEPTGEITFDHAIPVEDGAYLLFGTVTENAVNGLEALVRRREHWESVTFHDAEGDTRFEARLTDPPVLSAVASVGGSVERAVIEDGDFHITIHAPPTANVRRVIDIVRAVYPQAQLLKQRQLSREVQSPTRIQRLLTAELTERQHQTLEAAYHTGFFEWPREVTGKEVASRLDVTPPTFHQHLRTAERKVFDRLLSSSLPAEV